MEEQYKKTFDQMVDSLKMYQRYELKDKNRKDILDKVYVDPIENDGILNLCLKDNTTVLIGSVVQENQLSLCGCRMNYVNRMI